MRRNLAAAVGLLCLAIATPALAGTKSAWPVKITIAADFSGSFNGQLADTRASKSAKAYIMCYTNALAGDPAPFGSCMAWDGTSSTRARCTTWDPTVVEAIGSIQGDSWVEVYFDSEANCTRVEVEESSTWSPKVP